MKIAINGCGIAGPTLAWWLRKYGHEPVIYEIAPELRTGGYVVDFWGIGYDVADKMKLLPDIHEHGYIVQELHAVNNYGRTNAKMSFKPMRDVINHRFISVARSDISAAIYRACDGIETHFGTSIVGVRQLKDSAKVKLSDGTTENFDLVIGADGLHSHIREQVFGPAEQFEHNLGYYVAAFELQDYEPRDEDVYVMHAEPKRQVARFAMRGNQTLFLFICRADLVDVEPTNEAEEKAMVRKVFGTMNWEVSKILNRMDEVENVYFDGVSQIRMNRWTDGRVGLVGDAAAAVSLLAGEGTGLAMAEAYVLAGELHRADGDYKKAFANYEKRLKTFLRDKQLEALKFAGFFAPKNKFRLMMRNMGIRLSSIPMVTRAFVRRSLHDDIVLPDYEA